jgi:hypothetical protein
MREHAKEDPVGENENTGAIVVEPILNKYGMRWEINTSLKDTPAEACTVVSEKFK